MLRIQNINIRPCNQILGSGSFGVVLGCMGSEPTRGQSRKSTYPHQQQQKPKFAVKLNVSSHSKSKDIVAFAKAEKNILSKLFYDSSGNAISGAWDNPHLVKFYGMTDDDIKHINELLSNQQNNTYKQKILDAIKEVAKTKYEQLYIADVLKFEFCDIDLFDFMDDIVDNYYLNNIRTIYFPKLADNVDYGIQNAIINDFRCQLFYGLYYLFQRRIVHFDIKPENIFITFKYTEDGKKIPTYKIGDFGFAFEYDFSGTLPSLEGTNTIRLLTGTPGYCPRLGSNPEQGNNFDTFYPLYFTTFARDLYAFFVCIDLFFQNEDYNSILDNYNETNLPGYANTYLILSNPNQRTIRFQYKKRYYYNMISKPVNDLTYDEYTYLYNEIFDDLNDDLKHYYEIFEKKSSHQSYHGGAKRFKSGCKTKKNKKTAKIIVSGKN
jgi:serine/threonine protein kinase